MSVLESSTPIVPAESQARQLRSQRYTMMVRDNSSFMGSNGKVGSGSVGKFQHIRMLPETYKRIRGQVGQLAILLQQESSYEDDNESVISSSDSFDDGEE